MSFVAAELVRCGEDVHSGDARANKNSTEGRGDVFGHDTAVVEEKKEGGRVGGFTNLVRTGLQSGSQSVYIRDFRASLGMHK